MMCVKFRLISTKSAKVLNEGTSTYKEPLGDQMGKIMGKLTHTFNAFPDLQT